MAKASSRRVSRRRASRRKASSRKASSRKMRKYGRKGKRTMRRKYGSRRRRCWNGGANQEVFPAEANGESMDPMSSKLNLAQGGDYLKLHEGQHGGRWGLSSAAGADSDYMLEASNSSTAFPGQAGGAAVSLASSAPPGYTGMLDDSLRATARVTPLDESTAAASGMSDQSGGRRRRKRRGSRKTASRRRKGASRRRMRGGSATSLAGAADFGAPGMLLSPSQEAQALAGMNPEWKLASDPGAFKPAGM